jgi:hypothetical protein
MSDPGKLVRSSIFVATVSEQGKADDRWVQEWFARWGDRVRVAGESGSSPDWTWHVEGPPEAIAEIPERLLSVTEWSKAPHPPIRERKDRRHGRR